MQDMQDISNCIPAYEPGYPISQNLKNGSNKENGEVYKKDLYRTSALVKLYGGGVSDAVRCK